MEYTVIKKSRKEREYELKKAEIIKAAEKVFASGGYHGTTMAQISQASEYPLGTIYKFFSGKEQIYHDLVFTKGLELGDILIDITKNTLIPPGQRLMESLEACARFCQGNQNFIRIYVSERSNIDGALTPSLNKKINKLHGKLISLYQELFEEGIAKKEFKPYPSHQMAVMFTGIMTSIAWFWVTEEAGDPDSLSAFIKTVLDIFTHGITSDNNLQNY